MFSSACARLMKMTLTRIGVEVCALVRSIRASRFHNAFRGEHLAPGSGCLRPARVALGIQPGQLQGVFSQQTPSTSRLKRQSSSTCSLSQATRNRLNGVRSSWDKSRSNCCCWLTVVCKRSDIWSNARPNSPRFVLTAGGLARQPHAQLIGTPGIGLLTQLVQRHNQQPVQAHAQQQGEHSGDHAINQKPPDQLRESPGM